jgi:hypothetical protein
MSAGKPSFPLFDRAAQLALLDGIRSGVFAPNTTACRACDFSSFCPHADRG